VFHIHVDLGVDDRHRDAPLGCGCASACAPRSNAGPAWSTVRRSMSVSPAVDWSAISSTIALRNPCTSGHSRLQTPFSPSQENRSSRAGEADRSCLKSQPLPIDKLDLPALFIEAARFQSGHDVA